MASTSSNKVNRATLGVLASDNHGGRKTVEFSTLVTWAADTNPVVTLFTVPKGFSPSSYVVNTEALSSSAGIGLAVDLGDSGDADRLAAALDLDVAGFNQGLRIATAADYEYTADTDILFTVTGVPLVGTKTHVVLRGTVAY